jgi:hypothetical protein
MRTSSEGIRGAFAWAASGKQLNGRLFLSPPSLWRGLGYRHATPYLTITPVWLAVLATESPKLPCRPPRRHYQSAP